MSDKERESDGTNSGPKIKDGRDGPTSDSFVVGIGASAGGLEALQQFFRAVPVDTAFAYVVVLHLPQEPESHLPEILARSTQMPVSFPAEGERLAPNRVYVAPGGRNLLVSGGTFRIASWGHRRSASMPVDHLFRSLADSLGSRAVGVVLSGTGTDGTLGLAEIKAVGGITLVQEPKTAQHWGMPQSAIASGSADFILPPGEIATEIGKVSRHPYLRVVKEDGQPQVPEQESLTKILRLVRSATGVDFLHYKPTTLRRRIWRRMALKKCESPAQYLEALRKDPAELDALYQDILIRVTSFFRDPESFEALKSLIFPSLARAVSAAEGLRIWVPGCSTGEEVYSIAIVLSEFMGEQGTHWPVQLFATDVSEVALEKARAGVYVENVVMDISPDRLRRFFTKVDTRYLISKSIRDMCVFSRQNLISDPPFSRLDLISCRNVLIYFDATLQKKVLPLFHYALKPEGFLMLGRSEAIGPFADLFSPVDKSNRIYSKKPVPSRLHLELTQDYSGYPEATAPKRSATAGEPVKGVDIQKEADRLVLSRYAPAGVLINENCDIVQFRGHTSRFLEPAPGTPSHNLFKMAREGLLVELRSLIQEAKSGGGAVRKDGIKVLVEGVLVTTSVDVTPIIPPGSRERHYLVLFEEAGHPASGAAKEAVVQILPEESEAEIKRLRQELNATKAYLQSIIEEQEATNEELKSANEEILSSNEELQSTNEELETAKEELQSTNEELTTVNEELQNRNVELSQVNNDLNNLLGSVNLPVIMLGSDLRIRRFTFQAEKVFRLIPSDTGRPIRDINISLRVPGFEELLLGVIETVQSREIEIQDPDGRWYLLRLRPYRTSDNKIDGVVLILLDIDFLKRNQVRLAEGLIDSVSTPMLVLNRELKVQTANSAFFTTFGVLPQDTLGRPVYSLAEGCWNIPQVKTLLEEILPKNVKVSHYEVTCHFPAAGIRKMLLNARHIVQGDGGQELLLLAVESWEK